MIGLNSLLTFFHLEAEEGIESEGGKSDFKRVKVVSFQTNLTQLPYPETSGIWQDQRL